MAIPERPNFTPEELYATYLEGLKDYRGRAINLGFILSLKTNSMFGEFLEEGLRLVTTNTDYAGFHVTDPNWYEEGKYRTGAIHPKLYEDLEGYFREQKVLEDDQVLRPICYYSDDPDGRANLVIEVSGGKRHDWVQFILCHLEEDFHQFDFQEDAQTINAMKALAQETGRQEISWEEFFERRRSQRNPKL